MDYVRDSSFINRITCYLHLSLSLSLSLSFHIYLVVNKIPTPHSRHRFFSQQTYRLAEGTYSLTELFHGLLRHGMCT